MDIELMPAAELEAIIAKAGGMSSDKKMKLYLRLRDGKAAITKHLDAVEAQYKQLMTALENQMLAEADRLGVTGFAVEGVGTSYTAQVDKFSIADDAAFLGFVMEQGDIGFLERRISSTYVKEYMDNNAGALPPGVNKFSERVMRIRKAGAK